MSAQPVTGTGKEPDLSNLTPSRKEDFQLFAETPPRVQPEQLTLRQVKSLSEEARADRARRLRVWHANLGPFDTPQLAELHEDMWDIIDSNAQDGDKIKGAIAVDAFAGLGKTTAVLAFARKYHLREIAEKGRFTPDGHERLPSSTDVPSHSTCSVSHRSCSDSLRISFGLLRWSACSRSASGFR